MKISLILGHPTPGSFNHAVAGAARAALEQSGHEVLFHDLYAEKFDPVYQAPELARDAVLPPAVKAHCEEICQVEGVVIVHPNYWSQPPAMLKGWLDRVLRPGLAYRFVPDGKGGGRPEGLLKAKQALVITTANTPQEKEVELYGDPLDSLWRKVIFGICTVPCQRMVFSPVIASTPDQRRQWLDETAARVRSLFP